MTNERSTFGRYEIVPIGLDLSHDWLYDFMTLQMIPAKIQYKTHNNMFLTIVKAFKT